MRFVQREGRAVICLMPQGSAVGGGGGLLAGSALWDFEEGGLFRDDTTTFGGWWLDLFQEEYDHKDSNKMTPGRFAASTDSQILTSE